MKRGFLLLVLAVLALVAWWLWRQNTGSTLSGALTDFAVADTASVDRIFIAEKTGGTADLRRTPNGWAVNGMPAKDFQVALLLKTFKLVELRAPVPKSMEASVLRVMAGTARKVEIYQGGHKPSKIWWIGGSSADHYGTYMVLEIPGKGRSEVPFEMGMAAFTGVLNTRFHTVIDDWRSSRVTYYPTLTDVARVDLEIPADPAQGYSVTYKGGDSLTLHDHLGKAVPMDTLRVQDMMLALRNGSFEGFERTLSPAARDSVLKSTPWYVLRISGKHGEQRIPFWPRKPMAGEKDLEFKPVTEDVNRMYALVNDTALVVVQRFWWDRVARPIFTLEAGHPGPR
ncbi:MAG: hypothetical protein KBH07_00805 [Flavobacteriales bacterium]|nr:hypothetical protein [Flavobacteriales bacterium]MBP9079316.1 hypothetical protein [Flavobacteriales bacterium]